MGDLVGANPVDRGKPGSKYHLLVDGHGTPLAIALSAANSHDSTLFEQVIDAVPAIVGPRGRLSRHRWKVERTLAWLLGCRRLTVRYERRADLPKGCCTWPVPCCACGRSGCGPA